jgi:hypothetical protein
MMPLEAHQALLRFSERRGTAALRLLLHAAVPQSFRPDLLTLIRANFVPEAKDNPEAEADVMLAPFCEALGSGFFQLDNEIRRQCLDHLADLGAHSAPISREQRVAMLLLAFIERCEAAPGLRDDPLLVDWLEVQRWVAAAFLNPDATAIGLADALSASVRTTQPVAAAQLGAVTAAISLPLSNYPTLITYALGLGALRTGDRVTGQRLLGSVAGEGLRFGSVELPPPVQLLALEPEVEEVDDPTEAEKTDEDHEETVAASGYNPVHGRNGTEYGVAIFLSYARTDDETPPTAGDRPGWVKFFHDCLWYELKQRVSNDLRFWRDVFDLEPDGNFARETQEGIRKARLFIPILSPNYLSRPWCLQELETFLKLHPDLDRRDSSSEVFMVYKHNIPEQDLPIALRNRGRGYNFFEIDPATGVEHPYFMDGRLLAKHEQAYFELINELAERIKRRLLELPAPAVPRAPGPRRVAYLIGNEKFAPESGFHDLRGARNDVRALEAVLRDPALGAFEVVTFTDQSRDAVMRALDEALNEADPGDIMLLFYSGHGVLDPSGRLCLAMADTRASALYATSIPTDQLNSLIANSNCSQVVLLLDCSYSGAGDREITLGSVESQLAPMRRQGAPAVFVLTASTAYQTAREVETRASGQVVGEFTDAVVKGITTGAADIDKDGRVTIRELQRYLRQTLREQKPQYWATRGTDRDPVISRAGRDDARRRAAGEARREEKLG